MLPLALADTPGCGVIRCYSVLKTSGTNFYGAYGTWNRAPMGAGNYQGGTRMMASVLWTTTASKQSWVEVGHTVGHFFPPSEETIWTGYRAYWAYKDTSGLYREMNFGKLTPNSSITDEFQISRHPNDTNRWRVYFNGAMRTTPDVGFWTTPKIDVGGEVLTPVGWSDWFNMSARGITISGAKAHLTNQVPDKDDPPLAGNTPSSSAWNWRVRP